MVLDGCAGLLGSNFGLCNLGSDREKVAPMGFGWLRMVAGGFGWSQGVALSQFPEYGNYPPTLGKKCFRSNAGGFGELRKTIFRNG